MRSKYSDIQSKNIGVNTRIWQFCVILPEAEIGDNCNICSHIFIENEVKIGNNVTIKSGVQLWDGITIEDDVFLGPNVTFTNELVPRSRVIDKSKFKTTLVKRGASIGANTTVLPGIEIGEFALIGAGSLVNKNIPKNTLWFGKPAIQRGYVTNSGITLDMHMKDKEGVVHNLEE
jgi:acetyltransferase-like isoleucine patch superfamily enzyme